MTATPTTVERIRLPYTKPPLSLNDRGHWAVKARKTRAVRSDVATVIRAAKLDPHARIRVQLGYTPRDNRRRDTDNLVATLKAVCDGIVDAGLVPDDTPEFMAKPEPVITPADSGDPHLWVEITDARWVPVTVLRPDGTSGATLADLEAAAADDRTIKED